jgi:3-mercaptopyruvate sulfurtransferase SseA
VKNESQLVRKLLKEQVWWMPLMQQPARLGPNPDNKCSMWRRRDMEKRMFKLPMTAGGKLLAAAWVAMMLAGCVGSEDTSSAASQITVNSAAGIAQESAVNYDDNENGLVSGATLKRWKDDWTNERPAGITGKLVILQVSAGPAGSEYILPDGVNVFTYLAPSAEWTQTRSNGVITTQSMVLDGPGVDALLKLYNIDPTADMIVCAQGTGSTGNAMAQGRCWYTLRYWGVDKAHLSVLNGGNQWLNGSSMAGGDFAAAPSAADGSEPNTGTVSVRDLPVDNTALQATMQDMLAILPGSDSNVTGDGVLIWDARSLRQFAAGEKAEFGEDTDPDTAGTQACATAYCDVTNTANYMGTFQNSGSRQGHPRGTLQLQYTRLLNSAEGYRYRDKSELENLLNGGTDADGLGFVDATYQLVGSGNAYRPGDTIYTYCETTFRAMITGVASAIILGKPTRFYDGAMVEWNSLSHLQDNTGNYILPTDSPWRSDTKSFYRPALSAGTVATRTIDDAYARNALSIVVEDRAYKIGGSGGGGGSLLPSNPCGG